MLCCSVVMGKRENGDGQSMTSASSSRRSAAVDAAAQQVPVVASSSTAAAVPAPAARKTGRLFSLRRMIEDVQQQRLGSSRRQRRSAPVETAAETTQAAPAASSETGWYTPRATSLEAVDVAGSAAAAGVDDVSETGVEQQPASSTMLDCALCALSQPRSSFARVTATCPHRACVDCLRRYLTIEIMESRVNVECPACPERLHPNDVRRLLGRDCAELVTKYEEFALRRLLVHDPDARWCPAPDCGYVVHPSLLCLL